MDNENERNARLLESLKKKNRRLRNDAKNYRGFSEREKQIWMSGWASCETQIGLERLRASKS